MYVDPYGRCDTFTNKETRDWVNKFRPMVGSEREEKIVYKASPTIKRLRKYFNEKEKARLQRSDNNAE
jgi:hypothetical protein